MLEKTPDDKLKETVTVRLMTIHILSRRILMYRSTQKLTEALAPVKKGYKEVAEALKNYASSIIPPDAK